MNRLTPCIVVALLACGGRTSPERPAGDTSNAADLALPDGYRIDLVAEGLDAPTDLAFDDQGNAWVIQSGRGGEAFVAPRLTRIAPDGERRTIYLGQHAPWTGLAWGAGKLYIAEGGQLAGGKIIEVDAFTSAVRDVVVDLPSVGDHGTNGLLYSPDGYLYWGQGAATNAGVVGDDNAQRGWPSRFPDFHDTPCENVVLEGHNFQSGEGLTGAFLPLGTPSTPGQVIRGAVPCTGAILRVRVSEVPRASAKVYSPIEVFAWGFRNPYGLAFGPDGALYATENGFEQRGNRDIFGAGDVLWKIDQGRWYGWPDFSGGRPVDGRRFQPQGKAPAMRVLKDRGEGVPRPAALLAVRAASSGVDFSRSEAFGHVGEAFVAQLGEPSRSVVRIDVATGASETFASNFERPIAVRFSPDGSQLYVVDLGGRLFRIRRDGSPLVEPLALSEQQTRGQAVFFRNCNECHPGGEAGLGPALHPGERSEAMIRQQVRTPTGAMPPFGQDVISDAELDALLSYLRRTRLVPSPEPATAPDEPPHDPGG